LILLDEAARIDDSLIASLRPMQATTADATFIAMSTPAGRRGWLFETWSKGEGWERVSVTAEQCPRIAADWLAAERRELGPLLFAQEYGCEFADDQSSAFASAIVDAAFDPKVRPLWT
jgi:hypothetical protein